MNGLACAFATPPDQHKKVSAAEQKHSFAFSGFVGQIVLMYRTLILCIVSSLALSTRRKLS